MGTGNGSAWLELGVREEEIGGGRGGPESSEDSDLVL